MRKLCLLAAILTAAALAGPAAADDATIAKLWTENTSAPTQLGVAWVWASLPPCECGGTKEDCPCAAARKVCPVAPNCTCGCVAGGLCTCAQKEAYRKLTEYAEKYPGRVVAVYVAVDPPKVDRDVERCRYDAGWPTVKEPTVIYAAVRDGAFREVSRSKCRDDGLPLGKPPAPPTMPVPLTMLPPAEWFGACRT